MQADPKTAGAQEQLGASIDTASQRNGEHRQTLYVVGDSGRPLRRFTDRRTAVQFAMRLADAGIAFSIDEYTGDDMPALPDAATTARAMLLRCCDPAFDTGLVPRSMRYVVDWFLTYGRLGGIHGPALVRTCIDTWRAGAAQYGLDPPAPTLTALAELFERHHDEAIAYALDWEADALLQAGQLP